MEREFGAPVEQFGKGFRYALPWCQVLRREAEQLLNDLIVVVEQAARLLRAEHRRAACATRRSRRRALFS
jgi:hypothetical protein